MTDPLHAKKRKSGGRPMSAEPSLDIAWCTNPDDAVGLGQFFAANITPEYISHSELQGPRALDVGLWRPGIADIFAQEIERRIARQKGKIVADGTSYPILAALTEGCLVGIAFVSFFLNAPVPYAILEDIAVEAANRNHGIGRAIIDWITQEARRCGCARIFLESGSDNHRAHKLFERVGFSTCSVVMMKRLSPPSRSR